MRAVLVFCEGKTDVVFVERSLGAVRGYKRWLGTIKDLPSPFGADKSVPRGLIATRLAERDFEDYSLHASYPPSPQFESALHSATGDMVFLMISVGGKVDRPGRKAEAIFELIRQVDVLISEGECKVTEYAAAFLFDANACGVSKTLDNFRKTYSTHFGSLENAAHGQWTKTKSVPVGVYIFHKDVQETGTLEDHLAPMVEAAWPDRYANAQNFIDKNRQLSEIDWRKNGAALLKAIITVAGQFSHPGRPLVTIVAQNGLPEEQFKRSQASQTLVRFLEGTPWNRWPEASDAA